MNACQAHRVMNACQAYGVMNACQAHGVMNACQAHGVMNACQAHGVMNACQAHGRGDACCWAHTYVYIAPRGMFLDTQARAHCQRSVQQQGELIIKKQQEKD